MKQERAAPEKGIRREWRRDWRNGWL